MAENIRGRREIILESTIDEMHAYLWTDIKDKARDR
jgi:hypothetical protein